MKPQLFLLFVCTTCIVQGGETFYWNGISTGNSRDKAVIGDQCACWTNQAHTTAVAATAGNEYILSANSTHMPQTVATRGFAFPGELLVVEVGTAQAARSVNSKTDGTLNWSQRTTDTSFMFVKDMRWRRGSFTGGTGQTSVDLNARRDFGTGFSGRLEVINTGTSPENHSVGPGASDQYGPRNIFLKSDLVSEPDVVIESVGLNNQGVEASLGGARVYLMGDNSAFKGSFKASGWLTYSLVSDNALGDPATPNVAALQLGTDGGFEIHPAAQLGTTRGVTLLAGATGAYQTTHRETDVVTNLLAIAGTGVPFRSIGLGKIVYAGAYSAGTWTVEEGTLELTASATFPANHKFVVKRGATLRLDSSHNNCLVECETGATVVYAPVRYDNATATAEPIDFTSSAMPPLPFRVSLSERVDRLDVVRTPVLKLPSTASVSVSDFKLDAESVIDPLTATLEVVNETDAVVVYLNVKPAVVFTPEAAASTQKYALADTEYYDLEGGVRAYMWTDHQKAHDKADYLVTNGVPGTAVSGWNTTMNFPGESLCVRGPGRITTRHTRAIFKRVFFGPGATFEGLGCGYGDVPHWLQAEVTIAGTVDNPVAFTSRWGADRGGYAKNTTCIDGPILGDGYLKFNGNSLADVRITSTNESFTGGIFLETTANVITNCSLAIRHPYTLGGPLPSGQTNYYALVLGGDHSALKPLESMTLQVPGRGIIVRRTTSGFDIPEGVTLTVLEPIRSVQGMTKRGAGTLILGGGWYLGEDGKGTDDGGNTCFYLSDGRLKVVDGTTLRGTKVFVTGDIALVVDAAATDPLVREYGFYNEKNTSWRMTEGKTIRVEAEGLTPNLGPTVRVPICTVSTVNDGSGACSADRLRSRLRLQHVRGYRGKIVEDVPTAHPDMLRFTAVYERTGLVVVVR